MQRAALSQPCNFEELETCAHPCSENPIVVWAYSAHDQGLRDEAEEDEYRRQDKEAYGDR